MDSKWHMEPKPILRITVPQDEYAIDQEPEELVAESAPAGLCPKCGKKLLHEFDEVEYRTKWFCPVCGEIPPEVGSRPDLDPSGGA